MTYIKHVHHFFSIHLLIMQFVLLLYLSFPFDRGLSSDGNNCEVMMMVPCRHHLPVTGTGMLGAGMDSVDFLVSERKAQCIFLPLNDHVSVCAGSQGVGRPLCQTA